MKSSKKLILFVALAAVLSVFSFSAIADDPNPPAVPGEHGTAGNVTNSSGAPIDRGLVILLLLGAGYGAFKLYRLSRKSDKILE
jgi:hypothetical protein